jgi:phosphoglucosamine mutase
VSRLFGTDGVRGVANSELTPELALRIGRAGAAVLAEKDSPIVIGRDTRISGTMLEAAVVAGLTSAGQDVVSLGVVPTPAVARVTVAQHAAAGVMISASHNPIADNGIKFFGPDGFKLSDAAEDNIERLLEAVELPRPTGTEIGTAQTDVDLVRDYERMLEQAGSDLSGLHVVVDAAFGSAYAIAPRVLERLGATVTRMNCEADGARINVACGATHLEPLRARVSEFHERGQRAIGVAFDGDADRALFIDEAGETVTGDHVLFALGRRLHHRGELVGDTIVATVMTNIGAERALARYGIALQRAPVGDRYVLEMMREGGYVLGGEQSGHVINLRLNTTGDGPLTAVLVLTLAAEAGSLHELVREVVFAPQILVNVPGRREVLDQLTVREAIAEVDAGLNGTGRVLVRASGTEPLIRIMAEGDDLTEIKRIVNGLAAILRKEMEHLGET